MDGILISDQAVLAEPGHAGVLWCTHNFVLLLGAGAWRPLSLCRRRGFGL